MNTKERTFELGHLTLAAKEWGESGDQPVLAIHGWMDNAGSFDLLAPLLKNCHVVAIDTAGHGLSDHFPSGRIYNIWSDVADLFGVADQLGWDQFSIVGHSRGGNVGILMSGTFPERIKSLVLLDGGHPHTSNADEIPKVLASSILDQKQHRTRKPRRMATRSEAIQLRVNGQLKISEALTEILAVRGLSEEQGKHFWHADQNLKTTSELRLTTEILHAFYAAIEAPVKGIFAREGLAKLLAATGLGNKIKNFESITITGEHHFHMAESVATIALEIQNFYQQHC